MQRREVGGQAFLGILLVLVGGAFLLGTLGVVQGANLAKWIPSIFILIGVWQLFTSGGRNFTGPLILIIAATAVQLVVLGVMSGDVLRTWWPVLIILAGVLALLGGLGLRRPALLATSEDNINLTAFFSGAERHITSPRFTGGEATALFGGVDIDLRGARIETKPAFLNVTAMFGGVEIKVDRDWVVQNETTAVFGGAEDSRRDRPPLRDGPPDLILRGTAIFGGIEIKD